MTDIKLTEDGGVIKRILEEGQGEELPVEGCTIQVTYKGTLEDGKQFDASLDESNPFEFQVGVGQVIKGWDIGMLTMKKNEKALFILQSDYAYGAQGSPPSIPPNATLHFEVKMLNWRLEKGQYPEKERYERAAQHKQNGNDLFKKGEFQQALQEYDEADQFLETMYDQDQAIKEQLPIRNNMAMVYLKLKNYSAALSYAGKVLDKEPSNEKALYRKGQALQGQGELELARQVFKTLYEQDNKNTAAGKAFQEVSQQIKKQKQSEKQSFQKMFQKNLYTDKDDVQISQIVDNPSDPSNPRVFMDIKIGSAEPERIEIELYKNVVPKTAENFLQLCQNQYKNCIFHRNIKDFMIQGGDYENRNGTGGKSIYGDKFKDENFNVEHKKRGQLSMANAGPNTNGSQFFILYRNTPHLDGKHVVFGEVCKNIELLDKLENAQTGAQDKPVEDIVIVDSGLVE